MKSVAKSVMSKIKVISSTTSEKSADRLRDHDYSPGRSLLKRPTSFEAFERRRKSEYFFFYRGYSPLIEEIHGRAKRPRFEFRYGTDILLFVPTLRPELCDDTT